MGIIRTPLGYVVLLLIMLVMAGLTVAAAISGALTNAAVTGVGFMSIIILLVAVNSMGKK